MTTLNNIGIQFDQEVERESRYFDNIRELAEDNLAEPGEEFELDLELIPATDYYGNARSVLVREGVNTVGVLPDEDVDKWWELLCALHDAKESAEIPGRIWTSRDWDTHFYASVRLDMPTIGEAEEAIKDDFVELTKDNRNAWRKFSNFVEEYWDPQWVKAHGWTQEQVDARVAQTKQALEEHRNSQGSGPTPTAAQAEMTAQAHKANAARPASPVQPVPSSGSSQFSKKATPIVMKVLLGILAVVVLLFLIILGIGIAVS